MFFWLAVFSVISVYIYIRNKRIKDQCKMLPGPTGYPFLGNGLEIAAGAPEDYFSTLNGYWAKYGNRFKLFIGEDLFVCLADPKDVEVVLSNPIFIEKSTDYDFLKPWLGTGLLISTGDKWKRHRRVITPAFHFKILDNFIRVFDAQSDIFIKKLRKHSGQKEFNIYSYITLCALDIMCETAMGVPVNAQHDSESVYVNAVKNACSLINGRIRDPMKRSDFLFQFFYSEKRMLDKALNLLHGYTDSMIKQRRKVLESENESLSTYTEDSDAYGAKKKIAFLDLLLLSTIDGKPLSDQDIREEVDTFLFEGHDTVSSAIGFAAYLIGNHPDVQEKLYEEQMEIFPENVKRPVTHNDLHNMKYLELVIKEVLRMYPSVPLMGRKIKEDAMLNDIPIPKECTILMLCYNMNRNPEVFPEPDKFIPERYLPEESNKRNPFSSVFFSAGSRNCIGQKFAMLEMKATLSKLVRNYIIDPSNEKLILSADIILKSVNGINIKITSR